MKNPALLFFLLPCLLHAEMPAGQLREAHFYKAAIPGIEDFRASWSAVIERDGKRTVLSSADTEGEGAQEAIRFPEEQAELLLEWEYHSRNRTMSIRTGIRNLGKNPLQLLETTPMSAIFRGAGKASDWNIVGMHPRTPHAVNLAALESPLHLREYGGVYRHDGRGFFWGPGGAPTAYLSARFTSPGPSLLAMDIKAEMSGVQVDSGETRWGQQAVLLTEAPEQAVPRWADMVASSHRARAKKPPLTGWNNGNALIERPVEEELVDVTEAVSGSEGLLHLGVVQIERGEGTPDNLQTLNAPWIPDAAKRVAAIGSLFGIRLSFCDQKREAMIAAVRKAKNLGFNYLKIERPEASVQRGNKQTAFEALRAEFESIRQAVGEDVRLAYCADAPDRAVVGMVDESRVGRAAKRSDLRAALGDVALSLPLCGKWFAADLDNVYLGVTWIKNESRLEGSWLSGRLWLSLVGLAAGTAMTSDPVYAPEFKPLWKNLDAVSPPLNGSLSVPGLLTKADASRMVAQINRAWGSWTVAILWNPREGERAVELDFAQIGLDPKSSYAVWGYWDNRLQGVVQGAWKSHYLRAPDFQLLRFTELNTSKSRPTLVGSNLHVSCGAEEIQSVKIGLSTMVIELSRAGMPSGDLYIHSYFPPVLKNILGCTVEGISLVTENVWRIRLSSRELSGPQRIELDFLLPLTRQVWFWISIVAVASSLLFALWRYIVSLRLQRQQSLAVERARIAQDLHDDLGASLAQISFHGDSLLDSTAIAETEARRIEKMRQIARAATHALDEIVWAVDPTQDTFESFASYLCSFAQELLADSCAKCRFDFPDQLPPTPLPSKVRHNLFLAFKEALHNILRHSGATEVRISLKPGDKENLLEIKDNGKGFDPSKATGRPQGGHGLGGMRKRMSAIDGRCELNSVEGTGTEVRFFWKSKL